MDFLEAGIMGEWEDNIKEAIDKANSYSSIIPDGTPPLVKQLAKEGLYNLIEQNYEEHMKKLPLHESHQKKYARYLQAEF
ncbi:hypothetical protein K9L97_00685 [Candidatus Woesearchaeota archaeon]|nr:hypothetical protein [Candidatus Woesearchaeota archaeon]